MRVQTQIRSICPAWAKALASNPKTPVASHRPNSGETCKHNCGFALDSYWVYQWIDFNEIQMFLAGEAAPVKCELCASVARPGKLLCDSCADLETTRGIDVKVEAEPVPAPAPEVVKRRGRAKKEQPTPVVDECLVCGSPQCDCVSRLAITYSVTGIEDLL